MTLDGTGEALADAGTRHVNKLPCCKKIDLQFRPDIEFRFVGAAEAEACAVPADPAQLGHSPERYDVPGQGLPDMGWIKIGSAGEKRGGTARQQRYGLLQATGLGK